MTEIRTRAQFNKLAGSLIQRAGSLETDAEARLPQGLVLRCRRIPESHARRRWELILARERAWPSDDEVETCRTAFHVPTCANQRHRRRHGTHPKSGRSVQYCIVEITWHEHDRAQAWNESR